MKRKQTKEEEIEDEDQGDQEEVVKKDDEDEDEDDEDKDEELIDVDFDFFDPKEIDFHGLKSLIKQTFQNDADQFDISGLADLVITNAHLGSVVKVDDSTDPYAVMTVLSFIPDSKTKKLNPAVTAIKEYLTSKSLKSNKQKHDEFQHILSDTNSGLLLNERLINMPPQIVIPMIKMLDEELEWSVEEKKEKRFEYLVYISKTYQEVEPVADEGEDDDEEEGAPKKKKKKAAAATASGASKVILNFHVEDVVFEKHAEIQFDFQFTNQTDQSELQQTAGIKTSRRVYVIKRGKLPEIQAAMKKLLE
ncbi:Mss4p nuclear export [Rhizoclosmatium sp. JEL0117]|nr:Mss4p nuclear export [Rhizoclosmatium sp. JEL0117]